MTDRLLSTAEAAHRLGLSRRQVQWLVSEGQLTAVRVGRGYVIRESDLGKVARRPVGRPKKGEGR